MAEAAILEPPVQEDAPASPEEAAAPEEVPSVFSVTQRHLVGAADVSPPAEDGRRILRLFSANGSTVIEANLAPPLCEFVSNKLVTVEVIEEDAEVADVSGATTD